MRLSFDCYLAKNKCSICITLHYNQTEGKYDYDNVDYSINFVENFKGGKIDFKRKKLIFSAPFKIQEFTGSVAGNWQSFDLVTIGKYAFIQLLDSQKSWV